MQGAGLQLIPGVAHDGQPIAEIQRHMAPFAALLVDVAAEPLSLGVALNPADEFRSLYARQYRAFLSDWL